MTDSHTALRARMRGEVNYGDCSVCNTPLEPVWFTEEEYVVQNGAMFKTGRKRRAVDSLVCPNCMHSECVDDSFDGPWH